MIAIWSMMEPGVRCAGRVSGTECKQLQCVAGRGPAFLLSEGQLQILAYNLDVFGRCKLGPLVARKETYFNSLLSRNFCP